MHNIIANVHTSLQNAVLPLLVREKFFTDIYDTYPDSNSPLLRILFRIRSKLLLSSSVTQNLKSDLDELCLNFREQIDNNIQQDMGEFYILLIKYLSDELNLATGNEQLSPVGDFLIGETLNSYANRCISNHWELYERSILTANKRFYQIERYECHNCLKNNCDENCGCKRTRLQIAPLNYLQLGCIADLNSGIYVTFLNEVGIPQKTFSHEVVNFDAVVENDWATLCANILKSNQSPHNDWTQPNINQDIICLTSKEDSNKKKYLKIYVIEIKRMPGVRNEPSICHIKGAHSIDQFPTLHALCSELGNLVCFQECPSPKYFAVPIAVSCSDPNDMEIPTHPLSIPYYVFFKNSNYYSFKHQLQENLPQICGIKKHFNPLNCVFYLRRNVSDQDFTNMSKWTIFWKRATHEHEYGLWRYVQVRPEPEILILQRDQWSPFKFTMELQPISISNFILKSFTAKRHVMYRCNCTKTESNGSQQCWVFDRKIIDQVPTDLVILIDTSLPNPITKKQQKIHRKFTIDNDELRLPIIKIQHDSNNNDENENKNNNDENENKNNNDENANANENASSQYTTASTQDHNYQLNGAVQHRGGAEAGHYTNNIRNDNVPATSTWVSINNADVNYHNDTNKLSKDLIACWYRLQT